MKKTTKIIIFFILLITGVVLGRMLRSSPPETSSTPNTAVSYETKEHTGGDVTVTVTPLSFKLGLPASFDVAFETHTVDLTFDVGKIATLTGGNGTIYIPFWDGSPPGGHHRKGTLRFAPDLSKARDLTLTFRDIAGIPTRTFSWEVKQ